MTIADPRADASPDAGFVEIEGRTFYEIRRLDTMPSFLMTLVGDTDLWMYINSNGAFTAGRVEPDRCLFPYETDDRLRHLAGLNGPVTLIRFPDGRLWRPFDPRHTASAASRVLRRTPVGDAVQFEESDLESGLVFRVEYALADALGVVRRAELRTSSGAASIELLDGYRNIMPADVPLILQQTMSTLVDGYKRCERVGETSLAIYALEAAISDSPQAKEALHFNAVWRKGLEGAHLLLDDEAVDAFERGSPLEARPVTTGRRGAYLCRASLTVPAEQPVVWTLVADAHLDHPAVAACRARLESGADLRSIIGESLHEDRARLRALLDDADADQATADRVAAAAHRSNVLFNAMRGGVPLNGYRIDREDFRRFVRLRNGGVAAEHDTFLGSLPAELSLVDLREQAARSGDPHLERLSMEYLPLTFGRRHGDPSRPWNRFRIRIRDEHGGRATGYEGNWRDIFQNWEAVCRSYPAMLPGVIAKFLNATTAEGYNPYRINEQGIDWEVPEPENPRSGIGYWGDHQIVYLHRLLQQCEESAPEWLGAMADRRVFSYAEVPYRFRSFEEIAADPRNSLVFDEAFDTELRSRSDRLGGDGRLRRGADHRPELVTLLEKLLVPALAKVANLVPEGGIWMNTQRPEWNDANNALAGHGLSMVTLYQLRHYADWCAALVGSLGEGDSPVSSTVARWCSDTSAAMADALSRMSGSAGVDDAQRWAIVSALGSAADRARASLRSDDLGEPLAVARRSLVEFFRLTSDLCDRSISSARREDGLYESYRVLHLHGDRASVERLAPILEGQVSILMSGVLDEQRSIELIESLFRSELYREDQHTFILYPRVDLPPLLDRNRVNEQWVEASPLLSAALDRPEAGLVSRDAGGVIRFRAELTSKDALRARLEKLSRDPAWAGLVAGDDGRAHAAYEQTFRHARFTGRSGTMHKYEGLGSVYWHMVSKLLLAVQETALRASDRGAPAEVVDRLVALYRRVRDGLGFRKSPWEFGAVPFEPYSHTPWGMGAQQPGMTGQVKEGVLARYAEVGVRLAGGTIRFDGVLLDPAERLSRPVRLAGVEVSAGAVASTLCGVPVVVSPGASDRIEIDRSSGEPQTVEGRTLPQDTARAIFGRTGEVSAIRVTLAS